MCLVVNNMADSEFTKETYQRFDALLEMFGSVHLTGRHSEFRFTINVLDGLLYVNHEFLNNAHFYSLQWFGKKGTQGFGLSKIGDKPWHGPYHFH